MVLKAAQRAEEGLQQELEDEQILQTKIVGPQEVKQKIDAWKPAIIAEITSLFETKGALMTLEANEARKLIREHGIQAVPSKCVFTLKPDGGNLKGKKKCRIVACGNYAAEDPNGEYFAAGADAAALRMTLAYAAHKGWHGINLDIKTAFLNAPMVPPDAEDESKALKNVLLKPPGILVQLGFFKPDSYWQVLKALYGFRQAPRLWGDHRDEVMRHMEADGMHLEQMEAEPSIWIIRRKGDEGPNGIILTYVDDVLIVASEQDAQIWCDRIQQAWETSTPEWVRSDRPSRTLGRMRRSGRSEGSRWPKRAWWIQTRSLRMRRTTLSLATRRSVKMRRKLSEPPREQWER